MSWEMRCSRVVKPYCFIHTYITVNPHELGNGTIMPERAVCTAFRDEFHDVHLIFRVEKDGKVEREGIRIGRVGLLGYDPGFVNPKLRNLEYVTKVCQAVDASTYLWKDHGNEAAEKFLMLSFPGLAKTYLPEFRFDLSVLSTEEARSILLDRLIEESKKAVAEDMDKLALDEMEKALSSSNEQVLTENQAEETSGTSDH